MWNAIAVLGHYVTQLLTGGGLMAVLWLIDHFTKFKIPKEVYAAILVGIILWAALASYRDEHRNSMALTQEKSEAWSKFNACDKDRAVSQQSVTLLSGQLSQRDGLLVGQQDSFNRCILSVTKQITPEPQSLDVQWMALAEHPDQGNKQIAIFVVRTNKELPEVRHRLTCPFPFTFLMTRLSQKTIQAYMYESGQDSDASASFSIMREWPPQASLVIAIEVSPNDSKRLAECRVTPKV